MCLKYCLARISYRLQVLDEIRPHDRTFEKSAEGDMTKLSLLPDHEIKLEMLGSSSMLQSCQLNIHISDNSNNALV